ncbi:hypothetical protein EVAR_78466_1 [Eumeta japonica]|uniref:Uncharacterized protein n=1 Tax=Eumeta variegata TaxID=151549 RepID=A0A4C1TYA3_EUMVA|nr:hypothetical protein EVAR_78466_1 [Eumeta japonica]
MRCRPSRREYDTGWRESWPQELLEQVYFFYPAPIHHCCHKLLQEVAGSIRYIKSGGSKGDGETRQGVFWRFRMPLEYRPGQELRAPDFQEVCRILRTEFGRKRLYITNGMIRAAQSSFGKISRVDYKLVNGQQND